MHPNPIPRFHPNLATVEEARQDYNQVRSDHDPIGAFVAIKKDSLAAVNVFSWNVMESDSANGYSQPGSPGATYGETETQTQERYERIVRTIVNHIQSKGPDLICLQEISSLAPRSGPWLFSMLIKALEGTPYQPVMRDNQVVDDGGNITFYNNETLKVDEAVNFTKEDRQALNVLNGSISTFQHKKTGVRIHVENAHANFSLMPTQHEQAIKAFMSKHDQDCSIVVGDFNCTVAPYSEIPSNIVTSVATTNFRYEDPKTHPLDSRLPQGAFAIDGCFYSPAGTSTIQQSSVLCIDPESGDVRAQPEPVNFDSDNFPLQLKEMNTFRMVVNVSDEDPLGLTDMTERLNANPDLSGSISLRRCVNLNNEQGIAAFLPKEWYDRFHQHINWNDFTWEQAADSYGSLQNFITCPASRKLDLECALTITQENRDARFTGLQSILKTVDKREDVSFNHYSQLIDKIHNSGEIKLRPRWQKDSGLFKLSKHHQNKPARELAVTIRQQAMTLLKEDLEKLKSPEDKQRLLEWAKEQTVFSAHRNKYWISGAFGRTAAVKEIDRMINEVQQSTTPQPGA